MSGEISPNCENKEEEDVKHTASKNIALMSTKNSPWVQFLQATNGAVSGALTRFLTQPFDVLKIRFQLQVEPVNKHATSKYRGIIHALAAIYKEEGLAGIWKGHNSGQCMSITYALVQFWSYEQIRLLASSHIDFLKDRPYLTYFTCGGLAGCLGVVASQPFDVIRTRVVASDPGSYNSRLGTMRTFHSITKKQGIRSLFHGMGLNLVQIYPLVGANFLIYKWLNELVEVVQRHITNEPNPDNIIPTYCLFINGGLAGVISKALVYPADFLKKRIQLSAFAGDRKSFGTNPRCPTLKDCVISTLEQEGISGFFKGMAPTLLKAGLTTAFYFTVYDYLNYWIVRPIQDREERELRKNIGYVWASLE